MTKAEAEAQLVEVWRKLDSRGLWGLRLLAQRPDLVTIE